MAHQNKAKLLNGALQPEQRAVALDVGAFATHPCMAQKLQNVSATLTFWASAVLPERATPHAGTK
jgi:hypothetical protein